MVFGAVGANNAGRAADKEARQVGCLIENYPQNGYVVIEMNSCVRLYPESDSGFGMTSNAPRPDHVKCLRATLICGI